MNEEPKASRELYWEEMSLEQKVETLGRITEHLAYRLEAYISKASSMEMHSHVGENVYVPLMRSVINPVVRNGSIINRKPR